MTISFSQTQLNSIVNAVDSSTSSLKDVEGQLDGFKSQFNKPGATLVQGQWDRQVNENHLQSINDEIVKLVEEIHNDFQELAKRQEELAGKLVEFAQANLVNEEDTVQAIGNTDGE